jgi:hypothetical protein
MRSQRSAGGAILLALFALVAAPGVLFLATDDLVLAGVGGLVVGSAAAYFILLVSMTTRDCSGYREGVTRVFFGDEAGGHAGWGLTVTSVLAAGGIVARIWRSHEPGRMVLTLAGLIVGAVVGSVVVVVVVMAFGDLVDWLLRKRRG